MHIAVPQILEEPESARRRHARDLVVNDDGVVRRDAVQAQQRGPHVGEGSQGRLVRVVGIHAVDAEVQRTRDMAHGVVLADAHVDDSQAALAEALCELRGIPGKPGSGEGLLRGVSHVPPLAVALPMAAEFRPRSGRSRRQGVSAAMQSQVPGDIKVMIALRRGAGRHCTRGAQLDLLTGGDRLAQPRIGE